jgi:hypothetical protein
MNIRTLSCLPALFLMVFSPALAQNFSSDARRIGMGGIGHSENLATRMVEDERPYSSIVIPLGLIQLLSDYHHFDPNDSTFDPILAMEYAANPLHYVFGRNPGGTRGRFAEDLRQGELSRDLNTYRGFVPTNSLTAEGLASPSWGKTIKVHRGDGGAFQGFFVGVGPYISAKTVLNIDKALTDVLASPTPVSIPNRSFSITDSSVGQLALSATGGYRARFAWRKGAASSSRDGLYVGMNYHYLWGVRYETADMQFRFDTDSAGQLTLKPATAPAVVNWVEGRSGHGYALDFGVAAVVEHWEFGFGANGVGNRIDWDTLRGKQYKLQSLVQGGSFVHQTVPVSGSLPLRVELPVVYTGNLAYSRSSWTAVAESSRGFQGTSAHSGAEWRLGRIELRAGASYSLKRWHPAGGIGLNLSQRVSLDVGAFGSTTNIERQLRPALTVSLRLNRTKHGV